MSKNKINEVNEVNNELAIEVLKPTKTELRELMKEAKTHTWYEWRAYEWMLTLWLDDSESSIELIKEVFGKYNFIAGCEIAKKTGKIHWHVYISQLETKANGTQDRRSELRMATLTRRLYSYGLKDRYYIQKANVSASSKNRFDYVTKQETAVLKEDGQKLMVANNVEKMYIKARKKAKTRNEIADEILSDLKDGKDIYAQFREFITAKRAWDYQYILVLEQIARVKRYVKVHENRCN